MIDNDYLIKQEQIEAQLKNYKNKGPWVTPMTENSKY